jgi:4-carboxymuconolactone decarboxylase
MSCADSLGGRLPLAARSEISEPQQQLYQVVRELAAGRLPGELSAAEQAAWRFTHQLTTQRRVDQDAYDQSKTAFGVEGVTDMLALIGAYQTVCGILNVFEVPAPE